MTPYIYQDYSVRKRHYVGDYTIPITDVKDSGYILQIDDKTYIADLEVLKIFIKGIQEANKSAKLSVEQNQKYLADIELIESLD